MNSTASLKDTPLSPKNHDKMTWNHDSCASMSTFNRSFGSIDEEPFDFGESVMHIDLQQQHQLAVLCEEWLKQQDCPIPDDFFQRVTAKRKLDLDQLAQVSMSSIKTEDYDGGHESMSTYMTKYGQESSTSVTFDPQRSSEDCHGSVYEHEVTDVV